MAKLDIVRRECEDIGTHLTLEKRLRGVDTTEAMRAIGQIQAEAMGPEPEPTLLTQKIVDFRKRFKIDPKIASSYRAQE